MPTVPLYSNSKIQSEVPRLHAIDAGAASPGEQSIPGQQLEQTGQAIENLSGDIARQQTDATESANRLRVQDAMNQLDMRATQLRADPAQGYAHLQGADALFRPDGRSLQDEYGEKYHAAALGIADSLGNQAQRQQFNELVQRQSAQFQAGLMAHVSQQYRDYGVSVQKGTIGSAVNDIASAQGDHGIIDQATQKILGAYANLTHLTGTAPSDAAILAQETISKAHLTAVEMMLAQGNVRGATQYMANHGGSITPNDGLGVTAKITANNNAILAMQTAQQAYAQKRPQAFGSDFDRLWNLVKQQESGGRQMTDGMTTMSRKGAFGVAQMLPETAQAVAKEHGIPWDEAEFMAEDGQYNEGLGKILLGDLLQKFGNNIGMAVAAYHNGEGDIKGRVIKAAATRTDWRAGLGPEAAPYVKNITAAYESGQGTGPRATLNDIIAAATGSEAAQANPQIIPTMIAHINSLYEADKRSQDDQKNQSEANLLQAIAQGGGHITAVPQNVIADVMVHNPAALKGALDYGKRLQQGDDSTNPEALKLVTDDKWLRGQTEAQWQAFMPNLSNADFKHFSERRQNLLNGVKESINPGHLDETAVRQALDGKWNEMGWNTKPKAGTKDAERQGSMHDFVRQYLLDYQGATGKKLDSAGIEGQVNALFATNVPFQEHYIFGKTGAVYNERLMEMTAGDIPGDRYSAIKTALKANGIKSPTDEQILNRYRAQKVAPLIPAQ